MRWKRRAAGEAFKWLKRHGAKAQGNHGHGYPTLYRLSDRSRLLVFKKAGEVCLEAVSLSYPIILLGLLVSTVFRSPFLKRKFEKNVPVGLVGMWVCGPGRRSEAKP